MNKEKYELKILGKVSKPVIEKLNFKFDNPNSVFFADFVEGSIPIGAEFTKIGKNRDESCNAKVIKVTQQFGKEFEEEIPKGWKTIIELQTKSDILLNMQEIDDWYASDTYAIIEN